MRTSLGSIRACVLCDSNALEREALWSHPVFDRLVK